MKNKHTFPFSFRFFFVTADVPYWGACATFRRIISWGPICFCGMFFCFCFGKVFLVFVLFLGRSFLFCLGIVVVFIGIIKLLLVVIVVVVGFGKVGGVGS